MRFLRVVLLVISLLAFSTVGKSATPQSSAAKQAAQKGDIPKSIAESVSGPLEFVEGSFLGVGCATYLKRSILSSLRPESSTMPAALANK